MACCFFGYAWVIYCLATNYENLHKSYNVCLFKAVTGFPCPSCGATRSLIDILKGNPGAAWHWNPLGFVLLLLMVVLPVWMAYDGLGRKDSFYRFYHSFEILMKKRAVYIPSMALILANWIWNIHKGL